MSLGHIFWLKNCYKTLLPGWEEAREHILATQKHNTIYLEWGIKFGVLGESKGTNIRGCESQIWLKMRGESHPGRLER